MNQPASLSTPDEQWTRTDTWSFWAFSLGMLLEAYIFGMATFATGWVTMPKNLQSLLLAWPALWLIVGIAIAGPMADRLGRKNTFNVTMALYGIGAIGIVFSHTYVLILIFLALLLLAAGGEMNTIMAASHEVMPTRHRSKAMFMELNFINLGGLLLAGVSMLTIANSIVFQRGMIAVTFIIVLIVVFFARKRMPESIRWLEGRGLHERAQREIDKYYGQEEYNRRRLAAQAATRTVAQGRKRVGIPLKLFVTITTAFAGTAGFGLMTYVLGPSYFPKQKALILLIATGVGFVSGFLGLCADRWSRKSLLLVGYLGSFVVTLVIYFTTSGWTKDLAIFWLLLIVLNIFVNLAYLTEDTLKGEVWPTKSRSTYTAVVRFVSIGLYIVTIYLSANYNLSQYMLFNLVVWGIGLIGALVWTFAGSETGKGVSLEAASDDF